MPFNPEVDDALVIENTPYRVAEHPAAPGIPYGQAGRRAIVYQVVAGEEKRALKVFSPRFRTPRLALAAQNLAPYASLPGLQVCQRIVLVPERNRDLLERHPDLAYAMLMPWIQGATWMEAMMRKRPLGRMRSLELARSLAKVLSRMEEEGLAHCDLSGPNVMLPLEGNVVLVDVEEMYGPELEEPEALPCGTPGYSHRAAADGLWGPMADRFAGGVLVAEMLGGCDERVREAAWGEQYFAEQEMQVKCKRYHLLAGRLEEQWSTGVAELLEQAWSSENLENCPEFGEWSDALAKVTSERDSVAVADEAHQESSGAETGKARSLVDQARRLETEGQLGTALEVYRQAQEAAPRETSLAEELGYMIDELEVRLRKEAELARLFDRGLEAYREADWARAKELLSDVEQKRPEYERDGRSVKSLQEEVERRLSEFRRGVPGWAWALGGGALLMIGLYLAGGLGPKPIEPLFPTAGVIQTPTSLSGGVSAETPISTTIPTATPTSATSATDTKRPSPTPTRRPASTPIPTRVSATTPTLTGPEQGQTYHSPVEFRWQGRLHQGQSYLVRAWNAESNYSLESPSLSSDSWTTGLPSEEFGEWRWNVSVVQGGRVLATSSEGIFWFNPFPNGGGGGDDQGDGGDSYPPPTTYP